MATYLSMGKRLVSMLTELIEGTYGEPIAASSGHGSSGSHGGRGGRGRGRVVGGLEAARGVEGSG